DSTHQEHTATFIVCRGLRGFRVVPKYWNYQRATLLRRYFRAPRRGPFSLDCRSFRDLRLGLWMMKVPLPRYSALYSFSFTMEVLLSHESLPVSSGPGAVRGALVVASRRLFRIGRNRTYSHGDH